MAMPAISSDPRYTVAEVLAFPADGNRYEVEHLDGTRPSTSAPPTSPGTTTSSPSPTVGAYWVADADKRLVEVWHPEDEAPEIVTGVLCWQVTPDAPALEIPLGEVFDTLPR